MWAWGNTGAWGLQCLKLPGSWSRHRRDPQDAQSSALVVSTPGQGGACSLCSLEDCLRPGSSLWDPKFGVLKGNHLPGEGSERSHALSLGGDFPLCEDLQAQCGLCVSLRSTPYLSRSLPRSQRNVVSSPQGPLYAHCNIYLVFSPTLPHGCCVCQLGLKITGRGLYSLKDY